MASVKTRQMLMEKARQLFAKSGFENTTMNDIALASKKGRRTLYTYFKSKEDIYMAVVEAELEMLSKAMEQVVLKPISPDEKIVEMIETHLDAIKTVVYRNGTLRAGFFRNIWSVEAVRKNFDAKEMELIKKILDEGIEKDIFDIKDSKFVAEIVHYSIRGIEVPYIRGNIGRDLDEKIAWQPASKMIFGALCRK